jgi:YggT family protein
VLQIRGRALESAVGVGLAALALLSAILVIKLWLYIVMVAVVIQAMLSWFNPYSPVAPLLNSMTRPFLRIFRKLIPPIGNVDLSPLFVVIGCQLLLMVPIAYFEMALSRLI